MESKKYLFVLGRNPILSRRELLNFCDEVRYSRTQKLFIGENLKFENPRDLPKSPEQIFLDRCGGVLRFGEIVEKNCKIQEDIYSTIFEHLPNTKFDQKEKIAVSFFGRNKKFLSDFLPKLKEFLEQKKCSTRIENMNFQNMTSGQIFDRKLLKKGNEFLIYEVDGEFIVAKTIANQNLRNYVLRDRKKPFRDAKMGMLPPKLAQILINLANPDFSQTIIDPFCGSGTICSEAAIIGFPTVGSDLNTKFVQGTIENFKFLSEKFRFDESIGKFLTSEAGELPFAEYDNAVLITEGYLGTNFESAREMTNEKIEKSSTEILKIWGDVFSKLEKSERKKVVLCLPAWNFKGKSISISKKLFAKIAKNNYIPQALFQSENTFLYERPGAFVAREICVLERK
jgi:tRNA G10  N-methylase Trm11